jgi:hypothetical protein
MGAVMRSVGGLTVGILSSLEIMYIWQHASIFSYLNAIYLSFVFVLYIILAFTGLTGSLAKFVSPIIGLVIIFIRLETVIQSIGLSQLISNFVQAYSMIEPSLSAIFSTVYIVEIFIGLGFLLELLGAVRLSK